MKKNLLIKTVASCLFYIVLVTTIGTTINIKASDITESSMEEILNNPELTKELEDIFYEGSTPENPQEIKPSENQASIDVFVALDENPNLTDEEIEIMYEEKLKEYAHLDSGLRLSNLYPFLSAETKACHHNGFGRSNCFKAYSHASHASLDVKRHYKNYEGINDEADAYRHSYWNGLMARDIGYWNARYIADFHERYAPGPALDTEMDYHNNEMGRHIYMIQMGSPSNDKLSRDMRWWIGEGYMVKLDSSKKKLVKTSW